MNEPNNYSESQKFGMLKNLTYLTQLGLTIALPLVFCIFGASWLQKRFELGSWIVLLGIILGIGSAACSLLEFIKTMNKKAKKSQKPPRGFNSR